MAETPLVRLEKDLSRCIERLCQLAQRQSVEQQLPAFCFTGSTLDEYLSKETNLIKAKYYYEIFETEFNRYRLKIVADFNLQEKFQKNNKGQILKGIDQMLQKNNKFKPESIQSKKLQLLMKKDQDTQIFNQQLKKIRKFYQEHNIDDTCMALQTLREKLKTNQNMRTLVTEEIQQEFRGYDIQYEKMLSFYSNLENSDGWVLEDESDGLKNEYRIYEESRTIGIRVTSEIQIEMLPFLAIACEIDFQKHYMSFVEVSEERKSQTFKNPRNLKIGYSVTSVPFLADRECFFYAVGYDRMRTAGSIFIYTESFEDNKHLQQKFKYHIQCDPDKVYLKVHHFCVDYKPITRNRAQIRFVAKADFKLSFLPLAILKMSARIFAINYFNSIVEKAKSFKGSIWEEKVNKNPEMYNFFQEKIDQYFGQK